MRTIICKKYICLYKIISFRYYFTMVERKEKKEKNDKLRSPRQPN
jgi:hypothetical protein